MAVGVVERTENPDNGTFTLRVCPNLDESGACQCPKGEDGQPDPGHPMYHYPISPPEHIAGQVGPEDWDRQTREHATALEARSRGVEAAEPPNLLPPTQQQTAERPSDPLSDDERAELEQLRAEQAERAQAASDRAELEALRRESAST